MDYLFDNRPPLHDLRRPLRRPQPQQTLVVHADRCTACGACVEVCMFDALEVGETVAMDLERCGLCGACVVTCPEEAIVWQAKGCL